MTNLFKRLALALVLFGLIQAAAAGPPTYKILRRHTSPGPHHQPGHPDAVLVETRANGYAYGYFGVAPRSHASRHFGFYRTYTQWSIW
jgi:hypothetical protein